MQENRLLGDYVDQLEIQKEDLENLQTAWEILKSNLRIILTDFYKTKYLVQAHEQHKCFDVVRLIEKQFHYWESLFSGSIDNEYYNHVQQIGVIHHQYQISMSHHILAYGWLMNQFEKEVLNATECEKQTLHLMSSVRRIVFVDMALAAHAYYIVFVD